MRKAQKKQAEEFAALLEQVHREIKKYLDAGNSAIALDLLVQCQEGALKLGELIEKTEGEGFQTVSLVERYCELVYQIYEEIAGGQKISGNQAYKRLRRLQIEMENSIRNDVKLRREMVFLPYKASMWDSLESVWQAAEKDPDCDAYVVPIPYYDKNPDGTLGAYHYEGNRLPVDVPILHYDTYLFEERRPDAIFIHTPYDYANYVTTIDPKFYSAELKKYTECLVYIPYYATAGGMSEGQAMAPAYLNADYIVIQSEQYKRFFDKSIPDKKFLPFGSPKFDSVIHKCQNPPEVPEEWKLNEAGIQKFKNGKVYFYNTSINGMLANTEVFLKKMRYVFDTFKGRDDACLLWRPHPLLESTFSTMRSAYKPQYDALKKEFQDNNIGILDETPDIETAIALSDVYIGDSGTSVTSLFGVAGKPLFIFNNNINTLPGPDDWRGERINPQFNAWGDDRYQVTLNNELWFSERNDYHYTFYMDLETNYSEGRYYMAAVEIKGKIYVFPANARNLLIIEDKRIRRIELKELTARRGAFYSYWYNEKYIFLFPYEYPYLVRFTLDTEEICYMEGIGQFNVRMADGEKCAGGIGLYENELVFASPADNQFVFVDIDTLKARALSSNTRCNFGTQGIVAEGDNLWLLPLNGMTLTCWNPKTGDLREYDNVPEEFKSIRWPYEYECKEIPFGNIAFSKESGRDNIILSPSWGNMYLSLDRQTGRMEEWNPPLAFRNRGRNGYFIAGGMGGFVITYPQQGKADCRIWYTPERKLYDINIDTKEYKEVKITFDCDELKRHEPGFMEESEWLQYCLGENAFNSLKDLLDDNITGKPFDRERQLKAFSKINADTEGTCGRNVYNFVKGQII